MKKIILIAGAFALFTACETQKAAQNLPKNAVLKPANEKQADIDREDLAALKSQIDSIVGSVACTNADDWRISPLGSKPCGGPAFYIAYPKKLEATILPRIQKYTSEQSEFNRRNKILSDCSMVAPPTGIRCENGKAVLAKSGSDKSIY